MLILFVLLVVSAVSCMCASRVSNFEAEVCNNIDSSTLRRSVNTLIRNNGRYHKKQLRQVQKGLKIENHIMYFDLPNESNVGIYIEYINENDWMRTVLLSKDDKVQLCNLNKITNMRLFDQRQYNDILNDSPARLFDEDTNIDSTILETLWAYRNNKPVKIADILRNRNWDSVFWKSDDDVTTMPVTEPPQMDDVTTMPVTESSRMDDVVTIMPVTESSRMDDVVTIMPVTESSRMDDVTTMPASGPVRNTKMLTFNG